MDCREVKIFLTDLIGRFSKQSNAEMLLNEAIDFIDTQQQTIEKLKCCGNWISVNDRLPVESDNKKGMLLYLKNTRGFEWQQIGEFDGNSFGVQDEQTICHCLMDDETVTHWQPLSEAPKESVTPKD